MKTIIDFSESEHPWNDYTDYMGKIFQEYVNEEVKKHMEIQEQEAFNLAKLQKKIAELKTVYICNKNLKYKMDEAFKDYPNVVILGSPAVPEGEIYELTDPELKSDILYGTTYSGCKTYYPLDDD